jgi:hypothetical protein
MPPLVFYAYKENEILNPVRTYRIERKNNTIGTLLSILHHFAR